MHQLEGCIPTFMETKLKNIIFASVSLSVALGCLSGNTFAAPDAALEKKFQKCGDIMQERSAAMAAGDFSSMEKFAKRFVIECKGVVSTKDYSGAYYEMAAAADRMGRDKDSLKYAEQCLNISYANTSCQMAKLKTLIRLKRKSEAVKTLAYAEGMIKSALEQTKRDASESLGKMERESNEISQQTLQVQLATVQMYKDELADDPESR